MNLTPKDVEVLTEAIKTYISDDIDGVEINEKFKHNSLAIDVLQKLGRHETGFHQPEYALMYFALAHFQDEYEVSDIDDIIDNLLNHLRNTLKVFEEYV